MIAVLMRDQQRVDIAELPTDRRQTRIERFQRQTTVYEQKSFVVLDEQCIASATAGERAKAQCQSLLRNT